MTAFIIGVIVFFLFNWYAYVFWQSDKTEKELEEELEERRTFLGEWW